MKQYVTYYRVSTQKQGESGLGLESQRAIVKHFLGTHKVIEEFTEIASGSTASDRAILQDAIALCLSSGANLVVAKADRLSRNVLDAMSIYEKLSGRLICCDIPNTDKFTLTIFFAIAERERELISIRTKAALDAKLAREKVHNPTYKLGNPNVSTLVTLSKRKESSALAKKVAFNNHYKNLHKIVSHLRKSNVTLVEIANIMNSSGYTAAQGGRLHPMHIKRVLDSGNV